MNGLVVCRFRLVGSYSLFAQRLVQNGELSINEPLVDASNRMLEVCLLLTHQRLSASFIIIQDYFLKISKESFGVSTDSMPFLLCLQSTQIPVAFQLSQMYVNLLGCLSGGFRFLEILSNQLLEQINK